VRGSFDFVMFQFQTDFSNIMVHRIVHMDNKIELKFLSAIQPFGRESDGRTVSRK
jgi:hypothetical protein